MLKKKIEIVQFNEREIHLWVPEQAELQLAFDMDEKKANFPFWAKIWPAAKALSEFIQDQPVWVINKRVIELAAGLGLPSLYTSFFASSVLCSDQDSEAVAFINDNIGLNSINNMKASKIDWCQLPEEFDWDVILMSDVNYDPEDFNILLQIMHRFLETGKTIIISTPQRLAGKAFISALLPFCKVNEERWQEQIAINVLVLKN